MNLEGNIILLVSISKRPDKKIDTIFRYYLINLSLSDIVFILSCIPFTLMSYLMEGWYFGNFACKASHFISFVNACS